MKPCIALLGVFALIAGPARAQSPVSVEAGVGYFSSYAWRGYEVTAASSLQPEVTLSLESAGAWLEIWGAYATSDRQTWRQADEIDVTLGFDRSFRLAGQQAWMSTGYVYYAYPRIDAGADRTQEVFATVGLDLLLAPSLNVYYDFDLVDAWYVQPALSHTFEFGPAFAYAVEVGASVGFTNALTDDSGASEFGWQDLTLGVSLGIPVGLATIAPTLGYSLADARINPEESLFWGGVRLDAGF